MTLGFGSLGQYSLGRQDINQLLKGVTAILAPGTLRSNISPSGFSVQATGSSGSFKDSLLYVTSGVNGTLSVGTIASNVIRQITGIAASSNAGSFSIALTVPAFGIYAAANPGTLIGAERVSLPSVNAVTSSGSVASEVARQAIGIFANTYVGSPVTPKDTIDGMSVSAIAETGKLIGAVPIFGVSANGTAASLDSVILISILSGAAASAHAADIPPLVHDDISGVGATTDAGLITLRNVPVFGVYANGAVQDLLNRNLPSVDSPGLVVSPGIFSEFDDTFAMTGVSASAFLGLSASDVVSDILSVVANGEVGEPTVMTLSNNKYMIRQLVFRQPTTKLTMKSPKVEVDIEA